MGRTAATWLSRGEIGVSGVFLRSRGRQPATGPYPDGTLQDGISQMPLVAKSGSAFHWVGETLVVRLCFFLTLVEKVVITHLSGHHPRLSLMNGGLAWESVGRCKLENIFFLHLFWLYFELLMFCFSHVRSLAEILIDADWVESQVRMKLDRQVTETNILLSWGLNPNSAWIRDCLLSKDCIGLWQSS